MRTSVAVVTSALGALFVALPGRAEIVYSDTYLMVGRYSAYRAAPAFDQLNPLAQIVTITLPEARVRTVGQAIQQLLRGSGYAAIHSPDPYAAVLLDKPLPEVHRRLGPMPLAAALKTLVGQPYEILVNPVQRQICVERKKTVASKAMPTPAETLQAGATGNVAPESDTAPNEPIRQPKPPPIAAARRDTLPATVNLTGSTGYARR